MMTIGKEYASLKPSFYYDANLSPMLSASSNPSAKNKCRVKTKHKLFGELLLKLRHLGNVTMRLKD